MFAQPLHEASSADARLPAVWAAVLITFDISHNCWVDDMDAGAAKAGASAWARGAAAPPRTASPEAEPAPRA